MWMSDVTGNTIVDAVLASVAAPAPVEPGADRAGGPDSSP
jgi:hypothetical protein